MACLDGYFDESGKYQDSRVVSFVGFVQESWEPFNREWRKRLRRYRLPSLHLSKDALKATGEQLEMYRDFMGVISSRIEECYAVAADAEKFSTVHAEVRQGVFNDVHYVVFETVLILMWEHFRQVPDTTINIVCDDDPEKACLTYGVYNRFRQANPEARAMYRSIAFADDRHYPQIQAADLLSWIARAQALYEYYREDYQMRTLYEQINQPKQRLVVTGKFLDHKYLSKLSPIKKRMREHHAKMKP
jgi:hypothetical protein